MKKVLRPSKTLNALFGELVRGFNDDDLAALGRGESCAVLRAESFASMLCTVAYELEAHRNDKATKREIAHLKALSLRFLRSLRQPGILSKLSGNNRERVAERFRSVIQQGDAVVTLVYPTRRLQYRLNFS